MVKVGYMLGKIIIDETVSLWIYIGTGNQGCSLNYGIGEKKQCFKDLLLKFTTNTKSYWFQ